MVSSPVGSPLHTGPVLAAQARAGRPGVTRLKRFHSFGVGERLITARSEPVFGCVYKLAAVEDPDGAVIPKIKVSENVGKITNPGFKKVYRFYDRLTGMAEGFFTATPGDEVGLSFSSTPDAAFTMEGERINP